MVSCHQIQSAWRAIALASALSGAFALAGPPAAHAGFLDFLFSRPQESAPSPSINSYAEPASPTAPLTEHQPTAGGGGRSVSYCVRLCDGQHFPLEHTASATPVETCKAMCPASKTKVFFGSGIDHAVARDGERYTDLDSAYEYRDHLVAHCTCNGKDAFGLAPLDAKSDPTLRAGDILSTRDGLVAYAGKRNGKTAEFTPVDPSTVSATSAKSVSAKSVSAKSVHVRLGRRNTAPSTVGDDEPGTVVRSQDNMRAELRGQADR